MTAASGAGTDRSRLAFAVGAAVFAVIGVAVVALAALVLVLMIAARSSGGGAVSANVSIGVLTIWMLAFVAAAGFVALRVFRMVRAGDAAPN